MDGLSEAMFKIATLECMLEWTAPLVTMDLGRALGEACEINDGDPDVFDCIDQLIEGKHGEWIGPVNTAGH